MMRWRLCFSIAILCGLLPLLSAYAQRPGQKPGVKPTGSAQKDKLLAITPERETAVTEFVEQNHPELATLLAHLKTGQPKEYERAVRDLFRVTEKLAMVKERDNGQYDLELKAWKAQSRAQLLVARLKMTDPESGDREELKTQLREILSEQLQARIEVLKLERERTTTRLEKLNQDIGRFEQNREAVIDGHVNNLINQVNANRKVKQPPEKKPGENKPGPSKPSDKKPLSKPTT